MKYSVYKGNYRLHPKEAVKVSEHDTQDQALDQMAKFRNETNTQDYYVVDPVLIERKKVKI